MSPPAATPALKRRRLEESSQTLRRPFRSPLKTHSTEHPVLTPSRDRDAASADTTVLSIPSLPSENSRQDSSTRLRSNNPDKYTPSKSTTTPASSKGLSADPEVLSLVQQRNILQAELRNIQRDLDTVEQARKIEADSDKNRGGQTDGELYRLIDRWTAASRQAAEELYSAVLDRVNRMGGPRAWRDKQRRDQEFLSSSDGVPFSSSSVYADEGRSSIEAQDECLDDDERQAIKTEHVLPEEEVDQDASTSPSWSSLTNCTRNLRWL